MNPQLTQINLISNLDWFSDCWIQFALLASLRDFDLVGYAFAFLDGWLQIQFRIKFAAASATYSRLLMAVVDLRLILQSHLYKFILLTAIR